MATPQKNGNGNGNTMAFIPHAISTILVLIAIVGGFWSLADPRTELRIIREGYLTLREFEQTKENIKTHDSALKKDIERISSHLLRVDESHRQLMESLNRVRSLEVALDIIRRDLEEHRRVMNSSVTLADRFKSIEADLQEMRRMQQNNLKDLLLQLPNTAMTPK